MKQFSTKKLFLLTAIIAVLVAFVAKESSGVVCASLFCVFSWAGMLVLMSASISHLFGAIESTFRLRRLSELAEHFRWAHLDCIVITWLIIVIVISNYIIENSIANAKNLIVFGWFIFVLGVFAVIARQLLMRKSSNL